MILIEFEDLVSMNNRRFEKLSLNKFFGVHIRVHTQIWALEYFLVKVLKSSIKPLARSSFSPTTHKHSIEVFKNMCKSLINGFRDLDQTDSLILTLYFHMHRVKFHLMKYSKICLDTLYFESPFEFMSLKIFNSCRNKM